MEQPELADDPRFATHLARGEQPGRDRGDRRRRGRSEHTADGDRPRSLNEAGVICGPIYTIADIFEDEQFRARDMLVTHDDPEFGEYIGPGIVPKFSRHARRGALVGHLGGGQPQPRRSTAGCSGSRTRSSRSCKRGGRPVTAVTICDVAPRDGLQNEAPRSTLSTRAELVNRLAASRAAADRGGELRQSRASAADGGRRGGGGGHRAAARASSTRASASTSAATSGCAATALDEVHFAFAVTESSTGGTRTPRRRSRSPRASGSSARAHEDGLRATVTLGTSFGCPFEGAVDPDARAGARRAARRRRSGRDRVRGHRRRRRYLARCGSSSSQRGSGSGRPSACTCTTRATPASPTP